MTGLSDFLDDFSTATAAPTEPGVDPQVAEAQRLESFEEGYRAGWDDSVKAQRADGAQLSSTLTQRLGDLSFTYHEAYGAMTKAMMPLLEELVSTVLPQIARENLGAHLVEQLQSMATDIAAAPVEIAVAPSQRAAVEPLMEGTHGFDVTLVEDPSLSDDQADIRFGGTERQIDLGALLEQVSGAVDGFATETRRKIVNG